MIDLVLDSRLPVRRLGAGGPLVIVLGIVLVLFSLSLSSMIRSKSFTVIVRRAVYDDECETLARLAVAESLRVVRTNANEAGHWSFQFMRGTSAPLEWEIPLAELPALAEDLGLVKGGYELDSGVRVQMLRRSLTTLVPEERKLYEALGVLRFTARITGPKGSEAIQVQEYGFRNVLTGPPRPFDSPTFFLGEASTLLTRNAYENDPNTTIDLAVRHVNGYRKLMLDYAETYEKVARKIKKKLKKAKGPGGKSKKRKAKKLMKALKRQAALFRSEREKPLWKAEDWKLEGGGKPPGTAWQLHLFEWPITVVSYASSVDLSRLNMPDRLGPLVKEIKRQLPILEAARLKIENTIKQEPPSVGDLEGDSAAFRAVVLPYVAIQQKVLEIYKEFQDLLIEISGRARQEVLKRARRLTWDQFRYKAHHVFEGPGAAARATTFLNEKPPPRGLVVVDDPSDRLVLNLRNVEGRLTIACKGPLEVKSALVRDPALDVLTIVGYKDFEVLGPVQAALLSLEKGYSPLGGDFGGSLILSNVVPTSPIDQIFSGTLSYQQAIRTGPDPGNPRPPPEPETIEVALGPTPLYRRLER
jgi:hypothetical protein